MKRFILQVAICWRSMCGQIRPDLGAQSSVTPRRPKTSRINGCNSRVGRVRGLNRLETRTGVSTSPIFLLAAPFLCHKSFGACSFVGMCIDLRFALGIATPRSTFVTGESMKLLGFPPCWVQAPTGAEIRAAGNF